MGHRNIKLTAAFTLILFVYHLAYTVRMSMQPLRNLQPLAYLGRLNAKKHDETFCFISHVTFDDSCQQMWIIPHVQMI